MDFFLSHWTKTGPKWTKTWPGFNQKVLNFIIIISPRIQVYYLQKCCEISFFIFKCSGTYFVGLIKTNLEHGPKHVQGGPKTVKRKHDPEPEHVKCGSKHVQTVPKTIQDQFHIVENHLLSNPPYYSTFSLEISGKITLYARKPTNTREGVGLGWGVVKVGIKGNSAQPTELKCNTSWY